MSDLGLKLPTLGKPLPSVRVSNLHEYRCWQQTKKRAYHAQLDRQVSERRRWRQQSLQQKTRERVNLSAMVSEQQQKQVKSKSLKIKTEQKYMQDNYKLMKQSKAEGSKQWYTQQKEHPFVKMIEEEEQRRKSTKNSFIFQNQLNDLQTEMRKRIHKKNKAVEEVEAKTYVDYVEEEFRKHQRERMQFQHKYLKIDQGRGNREGQERGKTEQELERGKREGQDTPVKLAEGDRRKRNQATAREVSRGRSPREMKGRKVGDASERQMNRCELPITHQRHYLEHDFSLRKQYDMKIGSLPHNYQKMITQRSIESVAEDPRAKVVTERAERVHSSLSNSQNLIRYRGNLVNPQRPKRQFKHYDIINNSDKIFVT